MSDIFDVVIAGGGAAGLSAALVLGRCQRRVLLCDSGRQRNRESRAIHCLLGHEGVAPSDLVWDGHLELKRYQTVTTIEDCITSIVRSGRQFEIGSARGLAARARKVLIATGLTDDVPKLKGIDKLYGKSVHHCPYCDGFEYRDQPLAVYGIGDKGAGLALMMKQWSNDVVLLTDGPVEMSLDMEAKLRQHEISVFSEKVEGLEGTDDGGLKIIRLTGGKTLDRTALFFTTGCHPTSDLSAALGCVRDDKGGIVTDPVTEESSVPGVYVAGDASRDVLLLAVAIGEGAKAGVAINRSLLQDDGLS